MAEAHFHSDLLTTGIVYGPFQARRRGTVVGINLLPEAVKICNFDCVYCHCGLSRAEDLKHLDRCPSLDVVRDAIRLRLGELAQQKIPLDAILISGNGEPTLSPHFAQAVHAACSARDTFAPATPIAVLTNGTMLHKEEVCDALARVDRRIIKLDAGPQALFDAIDRPLYRFAFESLRAGVGRLKDFVLQSIFLRGLADNTGPAAVEDWLNKVAMLRPLHVELYGLDRPAPVAGVEKAPPRVLQQIKALLESQTGIPGHVYE